MPIEKIGVQVYVVTKTPFDSEYHTVYRAISNSDIELLEYLFKEYHYTFHEFRNAVEYAVCFESLTMVKCIIKHFMDKYDEDTELFEYSYIQRLEIIGCPTDILDYLKEIYFRE